MKHFLLLFLATLLVACNSKTGRMNYQSHQELMGKTDPKVPPYLKAHAKDGSLCILSNVWKIDTTQQYLVGEGEKYDAKRNLLQKGKLQILLDSVAIFETNQKINKENWRVATLSILTGLDVALGIFCLSNPKACFGSCPTFYLYENEENVHYANAEGFSTAISPSMEQFDLDALNNDRILNHHFAITMKNEALETHCVNAVNLYAYPRKEGEKVYHNRNDQFYLCKNIYPIHEAFGPEGDISSLLRKRDQVERRSVADSANMSAKEILYLNFDSVHETKNLGLVLNFRQTLMTTYLIYNALAYMGDRVGDIFAKVENEHLDNQLENGIKKELGDIEVQLWDDLHQKWVHQGSWYETGPIAYNQQILKLNNESGSHKVKLRFILNKGLWKLDYAALTNIQSQVEPMVIVPTKVMNRGLVDTAALEAIKDHKKYVVSMPGDVYQFQYELPTQHEDYELFLYSKGYYLEWMRAHWLKEKNLWKLNQLINHPKKYLQSEAKNYKQYEGFMEAEFWNSKINAKNFTYHD